MSGRDDWPVVVNRDVLDVECPAQTCGAGPGERCVTSGGVERFEPHGLRWLNTFPGPLVRCPDGPCDACRWTAWVAPEYLGVRETAALLDVHENTVRNWSDAGILTDARAPGSHHRRFLAGEVAQLAAMRAQREDDE